MASVGQPQVPVVSLEVRKLPQQSLQALIQLVLEFFL